jgi:hypothetical protein
LNRALLFDLILYLALRPHHTFPRGAKLSDESDTWLLETVGTLTDNGRSLTEGERFVLALWRLARVLGPHLGTTPPDIALLTRWIGDRAKYFLVPGDCWSDAMNADIAALPRTEQDRWVAVLRHALTATGARIRDRGILPGPFGQVQSTQCPAGCGHSGVHQFTWSCANRQRGCGTRPGNAG